MNSPLIKLLAITFFVTLLLLPASPTPILSLSTQQTETSLGDDLITRTCRSTPDIHLCETSLRSDPRSSSANTEGLILIMIDTVESEFVDSLRYVNDLINHKIREPHMVHALQRCAKIYKIVLDYNVKTATTAVNLGVPKFGEQAMVDSGIEAQVCEREFARVGRSPLSSRNEYLFGVSNVAAALVKIME